MIYKISPNGIVVILILFFKVISFSQEKSKSDEILVVNPRNSSNCEYVSTILDGFTQSIDTSKNIIIISYKGKKESKKDIERSRLEKAKIHLTDYYKATPYFRSSDKVITSIGTEKTEQGKLDFYLDGKLVLSLLFIDNRPLNLSPCYIEPKTKDKK